MLNHILSFDNCMIAVAKQTQKEKVEEREGAIYKFCIRNNWLTNNANNKFSPLVILSNKQRVIHNEITCQELRITGNGLA